MRFGKPSRGNKPAFLVNGIQRKTLGGSQSFGALGKKRTFRIEFEHFKKGHHDIPAAKVDEMVAKFRERFPASVQATNVDLIADVISREVNIPHKKAYSFAQFMVWASKLPKE